MENKFELVLEKTNSNFYRMRIRNGTGASKLEFIHDANLNWYWILIQIDTGYKFGLVLEQINSNLYWIQIRIDTNSNWHCGKQIRIDTGANIQTKKIRIGVIMLVKLLIVIARVLKSNYIFSLLTDEIVVNIYITENLALKYNLVNSGFQLLPLVCKNTYIV